MASKNSSFRIRERFIEGCQIDSHCLAFFFHFFFFFVVFFCFCCWCLVMVSLAGEEEAFSSFIEKDGWDDEGLSDDEIEMNEFDPFSQEETYSQREEEEEEEEEGGEIDEPLLQQNEKEEKEKENGEEEPPFPWFHLILVYGVLASDAMTFLIIQPLGPDQVSFFFFFVVVVVFVFVFVVVIVVIVVVQFFFSCFCFGCIFDIYLAVR